METHTSNLIIFSTDVVSYTAHVPSFADTWGWVMVCYMFG
jgi:hypothetical protein